jgi:hypothetical protein
MIRQQIALFIFPVVHGFELNNVERFAMYAWPLLNKKNLPLISK